ncbi:sigma-70 family RNA polymerase sigma factor [Nonomuraea turkmeniaca]|uniref:Sigma-70 family RNA polymerase sigma factor n=1 Tax=Nonomuraea turkmeniaca TaxID=103838 RepID=A0A5S4FQ69_9ACTN|nr:RNA polymerase sigma factor SigJ [Nonomuraea turkmeniaca]TMR22574.1 sigma-70 family RNA polymerase sigma factor [Nonomuraea turkmeniaca]
MEDLEQHRRYLFAVAYRLLGSAAEAEDAVQEALLRLHTSAPADLEHPRAWLTTVTSRICLDMLGSARARRETYVGTWLPEPIAAVDDTDLGDASALRESVRTAVLLVLETLSPAERVAFVLHDVFGMEFDQVAAVVRRTPSACRQLASRARRRVRDQAPQRAHVSAAEHQRVAAAFLKASADGDVAALVSLLDPRVVLRSDGGGEVRAARFPVHGPQQVVALLSGLGRRYAGVRSVPVALASGEGIVLVLDGDVIGVAGVEIDAGRITELNLVVNPKKLRRFAQGS